MGVGWKTGVREPCWPVPALETQTGCGTPGRLRQPSASGRGPQRTPCLRERRGEEKRTVGKGSEPARDVTLVCGRRDGQLTRRGRLPAPRGTFGDASRWPARADRSLLGRGAVPALVPRELPAPGMCPPPRPPSPQQTHGAPGSSAGTLAAAPTHAPGALRPGPHVSHLCGPRTLRGLGTPTGALA